MIALDSLKQILSRKYDMKNLKKVKTIISWQVKRDLGIRKFKIYQSVFIKNLVNKKNLINCNSPTIPIKAKSTIEMSKLNNYIKADLATY